MPTTTRVDDLKINKLTQAQYDEAVQAGTIGEYELSIITDGEVGQIIQVDTMPEPIEEEEGRVVQYIGETIPDIESSVTLEQTTFGRTDSISFETTVGSVDMSDSPISALKYLVTTMYSTCLTSGIFTFYKDNGDYWVINNTDGGDPASDFTVWQTQSDLENYGFVFSGTVNEGDTVLCTYSVESDVNAEIDAHTFEEAEHPTEAGTTTFEFSNYTLSQTTGTNAGITVTITDVDKFVTAIKAEGIKQGFNTKYMNIDTNGEELQVFVSDGDSHSNYLYIYSNRFDTCGVSVSGSSEYTYTIFSADVGEVWLKNNEETVTDISSYGITFNSILTAGDILEVTYSPAIKGYVNGYFYQNQPIYSELEEVLGYEWNQKLVQDSPKVDNINWATVIDIHSGDINNWNTYPIYTIKGGLPDGDYEFYWQIKTGINQSIPFAPVTFKGYVKINNTTHYAAGMGAYVIDGQWTIDGSNNYKIQSRNIRLFHSSGNDLILFTTSDDFWRTDIFNYMGYNIEVPGCFKLSSIKNIDTGEEYIAEGKINNNGTPPYDYYYNGYIEFREFQTIPTVNGHRASNSFNYGPGNIQYITSSPSYNALSTPPYNTAFCTELDVSIVTNNGGKWHGIIKNTYNSYTAEILEASGDLENAIFGTNNINYGYMWVYLNTTTSGTGYVTWGAKGCNANGVTSTQTSYSVTNFKPLPISSIGYPVSEGNFGTVKQYLGETNSNYTNGYFYKATGDAVAVPESLPISSFDSTTEITVNDEDVETVVNYLSTTHGWDPVYIKELLANTYNWYVNFYNDGTNVSVNYIYWYATGWSYSDSTLLNCFHVASTLIGNYSVYFNTAYTPAHNEIQNGHWERIDIQPEQVIQCSTMPLPADTDNGKIVQYVGATDANYNNGYFYKNNVTVIPSSATISQTVGSSLSDLTINIAEFEATEQPAGDETVDFVYGNTFAVNPTSGSAYGITVEIVDADLFWQKALEDISHWENFSGTLECVEIWCSNSGSGTFKFQGFDGNPQYSGGYNYTWYSISDGANYGLSFTGSCSTDYGQITSKIYPSGGNGWIKDNVSVDLVDYGITYSGTPVDEDTIEVDYTARSFIGGWEQVDVQDSFPDQTSQSGKFLTTDGTNVSWATVDALPAQSGQDGRFLTTDGTTASWAIVDALPSQTSQSGKFLTTNGTTASWANIVTTPAIDPILDASDWVTDQQTGEITQTITVQGVTVSNAIFVSPGPLSIDDFVDANVICITQNTNQLTFKCDVMPTNNITLSVVILG